MPELPEVEYVARQLRAVVVGRTIRSATVAWPRAISQPDAAEFAARSAGQRITGVGRRAKYVLLELDGGEALVVHRRMTGNLILASAHATVPYERVSFTLDNGKRLIFTDPRKFGRLALVARADLPAFFRAIGPEPLDAGFTPAVLGDLLAGRSRAIKALLLDQSIVAGLGNIYADEALFHAGIHPLRPAESLTIAEVAALHAAIQAVLLTGIEHGGTTFGRHRDIYDEAGTNLEHLLIYRHTGQPCVRCGTPVERIVVAQRGTHFCPHCQPVAPPPAR